MSNINLLLNSYAIAIMLSVCFLTSGCSTSRAKYTEEEILAMGNAFEAAGILSSKPPITGESICDSSALVGKWKARVSHEDITLNWPIDGYVNVYETIEDEEYEFGAEGMYSHFVTSREKSGTVISRHKTTGRWRLQNGKLILDETRGKWGYQNGKLTRVELADGGFTTKVLMVTTYSQQEILMSIESSATFLAQQSQIYERSISEAKTPEGREKISKFFAGHRDVCGWDSRGYFVHRSCSVDDDKFVSFISIRASSPAIFKKVASTSE